MNASSPKVALVTGANGITGNAIVDYLVKRPTSEWSTYPSCDLGALNANQFLGAA